MAGGEAGEAFGAEAALLFLGGGDFAGGVLDGLALGFDFLFCLALCQAMLTGVPGGFALFLALADLGVVEGRTGFEFLEQGGAGFFGGFATLGEVGGEAWSSFGPVRLLRGGGFGGARSGFGGGGRGWGWQG